MFDLAAGVRFLRGEILSCAHECRLSHDISQMTTERSEAGIDGLVMFGYFQASPRHNSMLNRPLPATPPSADEKSRRKPKANKSGDGRKSLMSMLSQKSEEGGRASSASPKGSATQLNGQPNGSPARPPSVQYQNSSPIHDRSDSLSDPLNSSDDTNCDTMYAGPPTPFR